MGFYDVVTTVHGGSSFALLALAMASVALSVLIAVKPAYDPRNEKLLTRANRVGLTETNIAGIVALTGLVAMIMASWPWTELWLWLSVLIMVFYLTAQKRVTKPSRQVVADGGSQIKSGMQVILQTTHMLLLFVAFALMYLKPA